MKTYVKINRSRSGNYDELTMQILHPSTFGNYLAPIAHISWQGDSKYEWYGMRFNINAELHNHTNLLTVYKLASYIKERIARESPVEIMALIGGIECFYDHGMYIPITENGKQCFYLRTSKTGSVYTRIISANDITAQRAIQGMLKRKELPESDTWIAEPTGSRLNFTPTSLAYATTSKF